MKPRDHDPALYRRNVAYSWRVMQYVVSNVADECYVVHVEPNPGVGYDCLGLVIRRPEGLTFPRMLLNRNGINSDKLLDVWTQIEERGVAAVAGDLITMAKLTVEPGRSSAARDLCDAVVDWIDTHIDDEFCVGPIGWPGGCREVSEPFWEEWSSEEWPIEAHGPEIACGIGDVEVVRFHQVSRLPGETVGQRRTETKKMPDKTEAGEFTSLVSAMSAWGPTRDHPGVQREIEEVIAKLVERLGNMVRVHVPNSNPYIAVTFANEPGRVGAYVGGGFVDHIVELPGSFVPDVSPNYWRSELSTAQGEKKRITETSTSKVLCPTCNIWIPKESECTCGWIPETA